MVQESDLHRIEEPEAGEFKTYIDGIRLTVVEAVWKKERCPEEAIILCSLLFRRKLPKLGEPVEP